MKTKNNLFKKVLPLLLTLNFTLFALFLFSQGTAINTSGAAADNSAILDISSNDKGVLIPRMSETERLSISSPARGLFVYQVGNNEGFWYYDGSAWLQFGDNLGNHTATDSLNMTNNKVVNVATCTQNLDAANKEYVDNAVGAGGGSGMPTMIRR